MSNPLWAAWRISNSDFVTLGEIQWNHVSFVCNIIVWFYVACHETLQRYYWRLSSFPLIEFLEINFTIQLIMIIFFVLLYPFWYLQHDFCDTLKIARHLLKSCSIFWLQKYEIATRSLKIIKCLVLCSHWWMNRQIILTMNCVARR